MTVVTTQRTNPVRFAKLQKVVVDRRYHAMHLIQNGSLKDKLIHWWRPRLSEQ